MCFEVAAAKKDIVYVCEHPCMREHACIQKVSSCNGLLEDVKSHSPLFITLL